MSTRDLRSRRLSYDADTLVDNPAGEPFDLFDAWMSDATAGQDEGRPFEATSMTVSTVTQLADGTWQPQARVVLLKEYDEEGFVFYTNLESDKGRALAANPRVCLSFNWSELERQVRIDGVAHQVDRSQVNDYFSVRPRASQTGAWASHQSQPIGSREELEQAFSDAEERFAEQPVPVPPFWGGFRVVPQRIEFWQGRRSRLHDRIVFTRTDAGWDVTRLCP
ncbi:pyridoxamine 5'-phosphate oxidase [Tessaracoccus antarcticus]|uniref:Pyridoxine/pyridoxamine 5'-phosphate oxidase n=1 Tax=Tessaracoccus antarcticus TaxID=2479848 RepID=A0A3M0G5U9_9ACTN|nr:pyridoxamine 5'-phosphate oxidase [Tessaracoccus antarcticus]RMB59938.1 pyridoxamine 5'-phosphate oxidase [Tessaracoccus antarcticus]